MAKWKRQNKHSLEHRWQVQTLIKQHGAVCGLCGKSFDSMKDITIDHIEPLGTGGLDVFENMQLAHEGCNRAKGCMSDAEYRALQGLPPAV